MSGASLNVAGATDNNTYYPLFVSGEGVQSPYIKSAATSFTFNPSTGSLTTGGTMTATAFNVSSDARLKTDVVSLSSSINILNQIRPVSYTLKSSNDKSYGVIAQEIEQILPELVSINELNNYKTVNYIPLIAMLIDTVQKQEKELTKIKQKLDI